MIQKFNRYFNLCRLPKTLGIATLYFFALLFIVPQLNNVSAAGTPTLITIKGTGVNEDTGSLTNNPSDMWVGTASGTNSYAAIRFPSVNVPPGATLNYAVLQVSPSSNQWIGMSFTMFMDNADNSAAFTSASLPSQRIKTSGIPYTSDENWLVGNYYTLNDYKSLAQTIINRPNWTAGSAMSFIEQGVSSAWGRKNIVNSGSFAPQLQISYTVSTTTTPSPTPTLTVSPTPTPTPIPNGNSCPNMTLRKASATENKNYFYNSCNQPVYLTGSHNWGVFYDPTSFGTNVSNNAFINMLSTNNHSYMRFWQDDLFATLEGGYRHIDPSTEIYQRSTVCCATDGGNKFDLTKFNPTYLSHLKDMAQELRSRNLYMGLMFFNGWWVKSGDPTNWEDAVWKYDYYYPGNAIQDTTGTTKDNLYTYYSPVLPYLQNGVQTVINNLQSQDNVIFEIMNEAPTVFDNTLFQQQMVDYVHAITNKPVGLTTQIGWNISVNNYGLVNGEWTAPGNGSNDLKTNPPVQSTDKVVILDTDHIWGEGGNDDWVWKSFLRGYNPVYMDNNNLNTDQLRARQAMGVTNYLVKKLKNFAGMVPNALPCNTSYCLGNNAEMIGYYPSGATNPNLGAGWQIEYYTTLSQTPLASSSSAYVVYAYNNSLITPTPTPSPLPTSTPTPTPIPTIIPTPIPTIIPTIVPTATPTIIPTATPTPLPTIIPTAIPTPTIVISPTSTPMPTTLPTPTLIPTIAPTATPTINPSPRPTLLPTSSPTPTKIPTITPTPTVVPPTTITVVGSGVNEDGSTFSSNTTQMWVGTASGTFSFAGFRFPAVNIPKGATITSAIIQVSPDRTQWIGIEFDMFMDYTDNSAPFTSIARPSSRTKTIAAIHHVSDQNWVIGKSYTLGEYKSLVQSIVYRTGWTSGNAMSFIDQGITKAWGRKTIVNSGSLAPKLVVTYTP